MGEKFAKLDRYDGAVCERFKLAREEAGVTQEKIGLHIGLSRDQVASVEAARVPLRFWAGWKFCTELDINAEWLARGDEPFRPCIDYFKTYLAPAEIDDNPEITFVDGYQAIEQRYVELFREHGHQKRRGGGLRAELAKRPVHRGGSAHKQAIAALIANWLEEVGPAHHDSLVEHLCSAVRKFKLALKKSSGKNG